MSESNTVVAADGPVTVERDITVKPEGVIVEVSIRATEEATVEITDDLPAAVGPDQVGFHPEHTPETGEASTDRVTVETSVGPETPETVVYGAYLDTSDLEVAWEESSLRVVAEPVADIAGADGDGGGGLRGYVNQFLGSGDEPPSTADATSVGPGDGAAAVEELDSFEAADDDAEKPTATADNEADSTATTDDAPSDDERDGEQTGDERDGEQTGDEALEPAVRRVAEDGAGDTEATEEEHEMKETDASTESEERDGIDATEGSVAAALAAELEAGEVDQETRDVLADELGATLTGSQVTRLDHVQKRVDDIAAYMDPLEELLDAEGRPADVIGELREEVASAREEAKDAAASTDRLDETVETLRTAIETAEDERSELRTELDDATTEVETVRSELDAELDALRTTLDEELERVEEAAREGRRDIEADVADLQAIAGQMESLREALSTAFGTEPTTPEQTEPDADGEPSTTDATEPAEGSTPEQATDGGDDIESRLRELEAGEEPEREEPF